MTSPEPRGVREPVVRYPVQLLTPMARPPLRFPFWAGVFLIGSLATLVAVEPHKGSSLWVMGIVWRAVALLSGCTVAAWAEARVYTTMIGRPVPLRIAVALLVPVGAMAAAFGAALGLYRLFQPLGDESAVSGTVFFSFCWMASAGLGSLIVALLDVSISSLVSDLRTRITLAVLALVACVSGLAVAVATSVPRWVQQFAAQYPRRVQERLGMPAMSREDFTQLLSHPETQRSLSLMLLVVVALLGLPAILSACGKLAEAVMERLHPLAQGFDAVAAGRLNVLVEEAGSRDFIVLARRFNQMVRSLSQAQAMEHAFGLYVSPHVLERIRKQHGEVMLPATLRKATVFFADIRGFTTMSERLAPAQVLEVLNRYFERAVPIIEAHDGYLDKFIGDAMVVVFNGPLDQPDHAQRAVRCAIALQQEVAQMNARGEFPEIGELTVGVGVATGQLVAGNLGSARKMEYTVVGDTVNLASRLTSHAAAGEIWANQATVEGLDAASFREPIGPLKVKGKEQPVEAFRVWPRASEQPAGQAIAT